MSVKFHIAKTPHTYGGMRWSVMEQNGGPSLNEICRCPSMSDASLVRDALNNAAKDHETWQAMLAKASTAFTRMENAKHAPSKKRGHALQPSQSRVAESIS